MKNTSHLGLAGVILAAAPTGGWLVLTVMLLQFIIQMLVVRNYALGVVFITAVALVIASGGARMDNVTGALLARGVDTTIGCAIGLAVFVLLRGRAAPIPLRGAIVGTLDAVRTTVVHLAAGTVATSPARTARRELQYRTLALSQAYAAGTGGLIRQRREAEQLWPATAAVQQLAYRTLAACWRFERLSAEDARTVAAKHFGSCGESGLEQVLANLSAAAVSGSAPEPLGALPEFLHPEVRNLYDALMRESAD